MSTALALLVLTAQPQLSFVRGEFIIQDGDEKVNVPLSAAEPSAQYKGDKLNMQLGDAKVTFDARGLGIHYRGKGGFTSLAYMTSSPKLFSAEEIVRNAQLVASGERQARVSAVSGFEVVNDRLFLLIRWDDKSGKPWLETLVDVDTSGDAPKVGLIGRFGGFSYTSGPVCDELYSSGTKLFVLVRGLDGLAIGSCDTIEGTTAFKKLAPIVDECHRIGSLFYTVTKTPHGLKSVGIVNPVPERFRAVLETRGEIVRSSLTSVLVVREQGHNSLFSIFSGAKLPVEEDAGWAETRFGVLVWTPKAKPTKAFLRETEGWTAIATWESKGRL